MSTFAAVFVVMPAAISVVLSAAGLSFTAVWSSAECRCISGRDRPLREDLRGGSGGVEEGDSDLQQALDRLPLVRLLRGQLTSFACPGFESQRWKVFSYVAILGFLLKH